MLSDMYENRPLTLLASNHESGACPGGLEHQHARHAPDREVLDEGVQVVVQPLRVAGGS